MDMTDTDEMSDVDSTGGSELHNRSLNVSESHGSDYSDMENTGIYFT